MSPKMERSSANSRRRESTGQADHDHGFLGGVLLQVDLLGRESAVHDDRGELGGGTGEPVS